MTVAVQADLAVQIKRKVILYFVDCLRQFFSLVEQIHRKLNHLIELAVILCVGNHSDSFVFGFGICLFVLVIKDVLSLLYQVFKPVLKSKRFFQIHIHHSFICYVFIVKHNKRNVIKPVV